MEIGLHDGVAQFSLLPERKLPIDVAAAMKVG